MGSEAPVPPPEARQSGRVPFETIFSKTSIVSGNLTAAVVFVREGVTYLREARRLGLGEAFNDFAVAFIINVVIAVVANCILLALPIAGVIYYMRYLG